MGFTLPLAVNGQEYSFRDIRCGGDPRLKRIAGGITAVNHTNQVAASHFHGVAQAPLSMIPGAYAPNIGMSLRRQEWDYLLTLMPAQGYSDKRWDWELMFGQAQIGGMKKLVFQNFHFLGPSGNHRQGDAIIVDVSCYVQIMYEDVGDGVLRCPVHQPGLVNL